MTFINKVHQDLHRSITFNRRVNILSRRIASLLPDDISVLDVGCGNGQISKVISGLKKNVKITGIETLIRDDRLIPVEWYDGYKFPFEDNSFDYVIIVDVLHHVKHMDTILEESVRVSKSGIIIKDHNCNNLVQKSILHFTDWFGNKQYGVKLEYNFLSRKQWQALWDKHGLSVDKFIINFGLYPKFTRIIFWKDLDFIAKFSLRND